MQYRFSGRRALFRPPQNGHTVIIICGEYSVKFRFLSIARYVGFPALFPCFSYSLSLFSADVKARGADLHDIGVIDKVLFASSRSENARLTISPVIHGNSAFFVDVSTQVPGTALFDILHILQLSD